MFTADTWVILAEGVIALSALGLAIFEGYQTRKHNRVSVRPKIHIKFTTENGIFTLSLINGGLGPANLYEIQFVEKTPDGTTNIENIEDHVRACGAKLTLDASIKPGSQIGMPLSPGEARAILAVELPDDDPQNSVRDSVSKIHVKIKYLDIYDQKF